MEDLLITLFGDGSIVVLVVGCIIGLWAHIRANLSPDLLAKLPDWLIDVLDWLAGNYKNAENSSHVDPVQRKR